MADEPVEEDKNLGLVSLSKLEEIDRTARAYGWEIGRGRPIVQQMEDISPSNPFLDPNWRETFIVHGDQGESELVAHARKELELIGEDEQTTVGYLRVVQAFADMGHSGMSAMVGIPVIASLLRYENLSPITDNPDEWIFHDSNLMPPKGVWQNKRNPSIFSNDGGKTYYDQNEDVTNKDDWTQYVSAKYEEPTE